MFLVPTSIQESLTCDFCHKFLTVGPVKVYPDKKMKCGRCSQSRNDGGTVSMYSQIAQLGVFKCFNRFDGCDKLLSYHNVREHEEICKSRAYLCPECPETVNVPTFLMIKHFQDNHAERFLQKSCFQLDFDGVRQTETYLHRIQNNLFFVECRNNSSESFFLRSVLLGDQNRAEMIWQQFAVRYNLLTEVVTERKPCDSASSEISASFQISKQPLYNHQQVVVEFQLDLRGSFALVPLPTKPTEESQQQLDLDSILSPRKLKLSYTFQDVHPGYSISPTGTSINKAVEGKEPLELLPHCYNCSLPFTPGECYVKLNNNRYQWLCWRCEKHCRKNNPNLTFLSCEEISPDSLEEHLYFSCKWGCERTAFVDTIITHERYCPKMPKQTCPVEGCKIRGNLANFRQHFADFHPSFCIKFGSLVNVKCPATVPRVQKWYIWLGWCFVQVELSWEELSICRVKINKPTGFVEKFDSGALIFAKKYSPCLCLITTANACVIRKRDFFMKVFFKNHCHV